MNNHYLTLISIMVAMGALGGIINYFLDEQIMEKGLAIPGLMRAVIIGIGASLLVPLFLNTIASNLLRDSEMQYDGLFVFAGFCLIAAISSRVFIETLTQRVLNELKRASSELRLAKQEVSEMSAILRLKTTEAGSAGAESTPAEHTEAG